MLSHLPVLSATDCSEEASWEANGSPERTKNVRHDDKGKGIANRKGAQPNVGRWRGGVLKSAETVGLFRLRSL